MLRVVLTLIVAICLATSAPCAQPVSPEIPVSLPGQGGSPLLATNKTGDFIVLWNNGTDWVARMYVVAEGRLGTLMTIPPVLDDWGITDVALAPDRSFILTYAGFDPQAAISGASARRLDSNAAVLDEWRVGGLFAGMPRVEIGDDGRFVIWHVQPDFDDINLLSVVVSRSGFWNFLFE